MKKRFWYPVIDNDKDATTASIWSCFGYVWFGGGQMLMALLNSAHWANLPDQTAEAGIGACLYASIFGWLTWKQSYIGALIGFVLYVLIIVVGVIMSLAEGDFASAVRGWWAT